MQDYEEQSITFQVMKEHLIVLFKKISKFTAETDRQIFQIMLKKIIQMLEEN